MNEVPLKPRKKWPSRQAVLRAFVIYAVAFMSVIVVVGLVIDEIGIIVLGAFFVAIVGVFTFVSYKWFIRTFFGG